MPGMMDTVLNLGLNDETVEGLAKLAGDRRFAFDSYRRFIQMYSNVVLGLDHHMFEEILDDHKDALGVTIDTELVGRRLGGGGRATTRPLVERELRPAVPAGPAGRSSGARSARCSPAG